MKLSHHLPESVGKKIWIDIDNSPHVPFFKPIITKLEKRGYPVVVTAREGFQVCGLLDFFGLKYSRIGHHSGKNKARKLVGLFYRALQMMPIVLKEKPALALSYGSRSQMILARLLRIPSVCCDDYEPSKGLPFFGPTWLISPEVISDNDIKMDKKHVFRYPGIKEDVYVPDFKPDPSIKDKLGLNGKDLTITIRPPATEAHYHNTKSEDLFYAAVNYTAQKENTCIILLPRNEKQKTWIRKRWPEWSSNGKIIIPDHVVDGLNLIWHSDLVISGGGTMNREAAALGVPVYSIFRGKIGAVDRYLSNKGRLILLESVEDIKTRVSLNKRILKENLEKRNNATLDSIVDSIVSILENRLLSPTFLSTP